MQELIQKFSGRLVHLVLVPVIAFFCFYSIKLCKGILALMVPSKYNIHVSGSKICCVVSLS